MDKILKIFIIFVSLLTIGDFCFAEKQVLNKKLNKVPKVKNYEIIIPEVLALDSRTALSRNEINIIDKKSFKNLQKYKKILTKEINTTGLKYTDVWVERMRETAKEIKKHPNTIIIIEGFRNTEMTERENIALSKEHALFVASVFKDVYKIKNTIAAIGRGLEKNEELIYNCVIISLIKDINPSQSIQ